MEATPQAYDVQVKRREKRRNLEAEKLKTSLGGKVKRNGRCEFLSFPFLFISSVNCHNLLLIVAT